MPGCRRGPRAPLPTATFCPVTVVRTRAAGSRGLPGGRSPRKELLLFCTQHTAACRRAHRIFAEGKVGMSWAQGGQGSGPRSHGWGSVASRVRGWAGSLQGLCGRGCAVTGDCWKRALGSASGWGSVLSCRAPTRTPPPQAPSPGSQWAEGAQECQAGICKHTSPHGGTQRDQNAFNVV